ncbi:MAG: DNA alkylation repair protein [Prevotella sp.]|nr:DNA alkylation repair protein [Prevotella sp.]
MDEQTQDKLKEIKQSFFLKMDGVASRSMREKGLDYKVNWGVSIPDLRKTADAYGKNYALAIELWKENIRECKILATMMMPPEKMLPEIVELWMEQTPSQEIAEMAAFNLYQHLEFAPVLAFQWIAGDNEMEQICGYNLLARLFMKGQEPNERGIQEFLDQALTALQSPSISVRHAAMNCVRRFASLGDDYAQISKSALKTLNLEFF